MKTLEEMEFEAHRKGAAYWKIKRERDDFIKVEQQKVIEEANRRFRPEMRRRKEEEKAAWKAVKAERKRLSKANWLPTERMGRK